MSAVRRWTCPILVPGAIGRSARAMGATASSLMPTYCRASTAARAENVELPTGRAAVRDTCVHALPLPAALDGSLYPRVRDDRVRRHDHRLQRRRDAVR